MGHLAFAVFLLSWGLVGQASASNAGRAGPVSAEAPSSPLGSGVADESTCLNGNSTLGSCASGDPAGITCATAAQEAQDWRQTISSTLTGGKQAKVRLTPCPTGGSTRRAERAIKCFFQAAETLKRSTSCLRGAIVLRARLRGRFTSRRFSTGS